mgnify:CR=1 FL=1
MYKIKIFLILFLFFGLNRLYSQWAILKSDADSLIRVGTDYIYNIEFDKANQCFKQVIEQYPKHPAGYFLDAMVEWWRITLFRDTEYFDNTFLNKIEKVIEVCDEELETNPFDIKSLFFKGGAIGFRGRFYALRKSWLKAASDGHEAFKILIQCLRIAPNNHDIMLGTGIYNYFAKAIPEKYTYLEPLLAFLPKGDKNIGILQLKAAANNARYASVEAKVVLLQIYYGFESNYWESLNLSQELFSKYPNNPYFHRYLARSYVVTGNGEKYDTTWREILNRYIQKKPGYDISTAREAMYYIGTSLMQKKEFDKALKYFYKCDEACRTLDKDGPSGFMVMTNLKIGQIYDMQKKRQLAISQYNKVLSWKEYSNSHTEAKRYSQKPYGQ